LNLYERERVFLGNTMVRCPICAGWFPYSLIAKQIAKPKHDKRLILKILEQHNRSMITGEILEQYNKLYSTPITRRHLSNILKALEKQGLVKGKTLSWGRYGRTTVWRRIYRY